MTDPEDEPSPRAHLLFRLFVLAANAFVLGGGVIFSMVLITADLMAISKVVGVTGVVLISSACLAGMNGAFGDD